MFWSAHYSLWKLGALTDDKANGLGSVVRVLQSRVQTLENGQKIPAAICQSLSKMQPYTEIWPKLCQPSYTAHTHVRTEACAHAHTCTSRNVLIAQPFTPRSPRYFPVHSCSCLYRRTVLVECPVCASTLRLVNCIWHMYAPRYLPTYI